MSDEYVQITKIKAVENPELPTPDIEDFTPGAINSGMSIPIEYTCVGLLQNDVEIGEPVIMARHTRNGVKALGIFMTSLVTEIEPADNGLVFYTQNSVYKLEWLD